MSTQTGGDGNVSFSVKELLENLDRKVDLIGEKLDTKADRDRVHDLSNRLAALELTAVRREGPIVEELRMTEHRLEQIASQVERFENGVGLRIQRALAEANQSAQKAADRSWSYREKVILGVFALIGALGTVISTVVLLLQTGTTP